MKRRLQGRVAVVTGGGSGIGRASAIAFGKRGIKVLVADINSSTGEETVRKIKKNGGDGFFIKTDVCKSTDVQKLFKRGIDHYGRLDYAHNNAGIMGPYRGMVEYSENEWDQIIGLNLKGIWLCMKYEVAEMIKQGGGAIVNTASIFGLVGIANRIGYVASKHGVVGLTKGAALEFAKDNIRVNAVCPGAIRTALMDRIISEMPEREKWLIDKYPIGRMGNAEEIADAVIWLCSDAPSFATGIIMAVDGGYTAQ